MENSVYLLEDDESICELVKCTLATCGIGCFAFGTVKDFFAALEKKQPDLCLLDVMLPDGNGFDVLKRVKEEYTAPCIMLSALGKETDKVRGLNLGADDYISKPFGVLEFTARVKAALRRNHDSAVLRVGSLEMDSGRMTAVYRGKELVLSSTEFRLLRYFARNEGKVLAREAILNDVWGYGFGETRTLDNHVARLRKAGLDFETVFGVGYKFLAD